MRALILLIPFLCTTLFALDVPTLDGRVTDRAGILSADAKWRIEAKLAALETSDSTQIAVLTVPTLEGDSIEDFSMRVAEGWRLGQKRIDNGALLVIAKEDRKLRIEVGYGLEGKLTDALSGRIIRQVIVPRFRDNDFAGGVEAGVDAMIAATKGEFKAEEKKEKPISVLAIIFWILFLGIYVFAFHIHRTVPYSVFKRSSRGWRSRGGGGGFGGFGGGGFGGGSSGGW